LTSTLGATNEHTNFTFRTNTQSTRLANHLATLPSQAKRTKLQSAAPAVKGKRVCKTYGRVITGPKTEAGRQRCAEAKTIHGRETREARTDRSLASARLAVLEDAGHELGFMVGTRTRGRKPDRMAEAYPELKLLIKPNK